MESYGGNGWAAKPKIMEVMGGHCAEKQLLCKLSVLPWHLILLNLEANVSRTKMFSDFLKQDNNSIFFFIKSCHF
jgi:hypothetical protein